MAKVNKDRMTARPEGSFVVFLIGMRVNNPFAIHRWIPVFTAMPKMIIELYKHPQLGFKSHETCFGRTTIMVQYWESSEKLIAYAKSADSEHLPAWRSFNRAAKSSAVGIWHETYVIEAGHSESVYKNMPAFGLGKVTGLQPAVGRLDSATERLSKPSEE